MEQNVTTDLFHEILEAHHLTCEKEADHWLIRKSKKKNSAIQIYIVFSIIGFVVGLILFLFVWIKLGIIAMVLAGTFLFAGMNLRDREKNTEKKFITIDKESIIVKEGYRSKKINLVDIVEFRTKVQKVKNLFVGTISIVAENQRTYEFLEIFGNDEEIIQNDLVIIANYIVENFLQAEDNVIL
ncbi:MAG: hypothetical protein DWQ02_10305 [Bacteroidetes bacterium]|nr:MAG: hypothetical protein DWQ02_10305 [Bacteroidota bacterium]